MTEQPIEEVQIETTTESPDIEIHLKPSVLGEVAGVPITNSMLMAVIISLSLSALFITTAKKMKQIPGKTQLFVESFLTFSKDFVAGIFGNKEHTNKIFPVFTTLFAFFLASNLVGFIPGLAAISFNDLPLFRAPTSSYATIFVITMTMFIALQITVIVSAGMRGYINQFITFSSPINFVMGLLNIIGETSKVVSLSFRLFGNIFAGEVIATVMLALLPLAAPVPFAMLGLLSSIIQALVFPLLVAIYFKMGLDVRVAYQEERQESADKKAAKQNKNTVTAAEAA